MTSSGNLLRNCVLFGRSLRALGIAVTPAQLADLAEGLQSIDLANRQDVKNSLAALLVKRREQLALFEAAFDLFWQARNPHALNELGRDDLARPRRRSQPQIQFLRLMASAGQAPQNPGNEAQPEPTPEKAQSYSAAEILRQQDFAQLDDDELRAVRRLMAQIPWRAPPRRSRRRERRPRGPFFDLRRTLRQNMRYGGEMFDLARRQRKLKPRPVVVICDISGSMERYSRLLLQFLYTVAARLGRVETFVFSTRLTRITRQLQQRDVDRALAQASRSVHDWAGGTRIGAAIKTFNYDWARRVLNRGALVLIISDGCDRGDAALLGHEMARLHRMAHRVIWLNPLLGDPGYQPLVRGMQAALPHIDDFLPVHNLASLDELARRLADSSH